MYYRIPKKISVIIRFIVISAMLTQLVPAGMCTVAAANVINISSAEDLLAAQDYLKKHSEWVTFNQTCDIKVSPYTYDYKQDAHRIEIAWQGDVEAYYDVDDGQYYSSLTATGPAMDYQWKVASWTPLGSGDVMGSYDYQGNGHTIEGIYQKKTSVGNDVASGIFYQSGSIKNVTVKNYFGIGKNMEKLSVLGNEITGIYGCKAENVQLAAMGSGYNTCMGFVGELGGTVKDTTVNANLFATARNGDRDILQPGWYRMGILGGQCGSVTIENCHTSGLIRNAGREMYAAGGIVGYGATGYTGYNTVLRYCDSDVTIDGDFEGAGGIMGIQDEAGMLVEHCRFDGKIRIADYWQVRYFNSAGGICGKFTCGVINACVNYGTVRGSYGYYGGIAGSGEISNCINEAEIGGGFADEQGYESGDLFAGGIAGYMGNKDAWKKGLSVLNCGNRGTIISRSGSAGGVTGCQNGELSEIANVWNEAEITTKLEADSVTGTWISGSREHCIDGTQSTPEELCKSLNQWIASADMDEHFTMEGTDPLSTWEVVDDRLQIKVLQSPSEQTSVPVQTLKATILPGILPSDTPDASTPPKGSQAPDTPETSTQPEKPQTPATPDASTQPEESQAPATPDASTQPEGSQAPDTPDASTRPEGSQAPDTPDASTQPEKPQIPDTPDASTQPEKPQTPDTPDASTQPSTQQQPESPQPGLSVTEQSNTSRETPKGTPGADRKPGTTKSKKTTGSKSAAASQKVKWKAPVFSLHRKKSVDGQSYILLKVGKHQGDYVEVWARVGKRKYTKLKLSKNRLSVLKNKLKFKYSFSGKKLYFKLRTYQIKKGKKKYSIISKAKGIVTR